MLDDTTTNPSHRRKPVSSLLIFLDSGSAGTTKSGGGILNRLPLDDSTV
jgi:hypothetical protein